MWEKMKNKTGIILGCFVLELLLLFYFRNETGFILSPLLFLLAGFGLVYFSSQQDLYLSKNQYTPSPELKNLRNRIFLFITLIGIFYSGYLFHKWPIQIENSDIIPLIQQIYVDRFIHMQAVYDLYTGFNYGTFTPNYLPFHWFPFVLPELLHLDPRWTFVLLYLIATYLYVFKFVKASTKQNLIIQILFPFLLWFSIMVKQGKDYANTVELLIAAYYMILCLSLFSNKPFLKAAALILLILSRYSLVFWLPVYFFSLWLTNRNLSYKTALYLVGMLLVFYVPFLIQSPHMLNSGSQLWIDAALGEWKGQSWQAPGDRPFQLFQGMGFASWIYTWASGSLQEKILFSKNLMLTMSLISLVVSIIWIWMKRNSGQLSLLALFALKISLLIFYSFVFVPYVYLFWVTIIPSVLIVSIHLQSKTQEF